MIYGTRATTLGNFQVEDVPCPYCEHTEPQRFSIFGRYAHLMWIPLFPFSKVAVAECTRCKRTYEKSEFPRKLAGASENLKAKTSHPRWTWAGLMIIGGWFLLSSVFAAFRTVDPREALLKQDIDVMTTTPPERFDSTSYQIDQLMTMLAVDELSPERFSYITHIEGSKALILVDIPELDLVEDDARPEVLEVVEAVAGNVSSLQGKQLYLGVLGGGRMMLTKTPDGKLVNRSRASHDPLYDFYGPAPTE